MSAIFFIYFVGSSWLITLLAEFYFRFLRASLSFLAAQLPAVAMRTIVKLLWVEVTGSLILLAV